MRLKKKPLGNKGTTLVEVVAGFLMLAVILTTFIKMINLSSKMTKAAVDTKKNSLEFEEKYYQGYNYNIKEKNSEAKPAFRSEITVKDSTDNDLQISLKEWHKQEDGDYFIEWHEDTDGKFKRFKSDGSLFENNSVADWKTIPVNSVKLQRIENVRDMSMTRKCIYRYQYVHETNNG